jgi:hypothetical protein
MSSPDFGTNPSVAETQQKLDLAVDLACLTYFEALAPPAAIDSGPDLSSYLSRFNDHLLELVFVSDARARIESPTPEHDEELAWVDVAKYGLRRAARRVSAMRGLDRTRLFAPGQERLQQAAYYGMCERRKSDGTLDTDSAKSYADRVAVGEIGLDFDVVQNMN